MYGAAGFTRKGYVPLAVNEYGGIGWQGEGLDDFWMWNRQYIESEDGRRLLQTVKVTELKEAAMRYWRDGWLPVRPIGEDLLRRMEDTLRGHRGLRLAGVSFPEGSFLKQPEPVPAEHLPPELAENTEGGD